MKVIVQEIELFGDMFPGDLLKLCSYAICGDNLKVTKCRYGLTWIRHRVCGENYLFAFNPTTIEVCVERKGLKLKELVVA